MVTRAQGEASRVSVTNTLELVAVTLVAFIAAVIIFAACVALEHRRERRP